MPSSEDDSPRSSAASSTLVAPTEPEDPSPTTGEMSSIVADEKISRPTLPGPLPSDISDTSLQQWRRGAGFWRSFIAICIPLLLSALEGSVTNTALPTISDALNLGTNFSWVATAFLLASTVFQPLYSQLGDMWGRKIPLMIAVMVFAIGSAICGGAGSGSALIAGRIVQGLGTGGIDLFAEMILCDLIPLRKRGPYLGLKHFAFAVGTTLGPLLGGVFAEYGWRWCFLINIPVCAIALVVIFYCLQVGGGIQNSEVKFRDEMKKIDYIGSVMLTASIVMILVALSTGGAARPWSHPAVVVPILLGAMGLAMFACWECSAFCKYPIMSPQVFSNRTTNIAFTLTTIHGFITYGFQFYLPPFFQAVKGSSPTDSGIQVLPTTIVVVVLAAVGGPVLGHWGKYKPMHIVGFALMTLGLGLCGLLTAHTPTAVWVLLQLTTALGLGLVISTMLPAVHVQLDDHLTGASAGSWAFLRGTGSLFGVAVPGAIFNLRFAQLLPTISSPEARAQLENGQAYQRATDKFTKTFGPAAKTEIISVFTQALKTVWILFAVLAGVGFLLTWFEKQHKMRTELNTAYGLKNLKSLPPSSATSPASSPADSLKNAPGVTVKATTPAVECEARAATAEDRVADVV